MLHFLICTFNIGCVARRLECVCVLQAGPGVSVSGRKRDPMVSDESAETTLMS